MQSEINRQLLERNAVLEREVLELQTGNKALEQRAREQLGLVREGEIFYQYVEEAPIPTGPAAKAKVEARLEPSAEEAVSEPALGVQQ